MRIFRIQKPIRLHTNQTPTGSGVPFSIWFPYYFFQILLHIKRYKEIVSLYIVFYYLNLGREIEQLRYVLLYVV